MSERNVTKEAVEDALNNPLKIKPAKVDELGRKSQRYIGKKAEVVINPDNNSIVSVNPTSKCKANYLVRGAK